MVSLGLGVALAFAVLGLVVFLEKYVALRRRYRKVIDVDAEAASIHREVERLEAEAARLETTNKSRRGALESDYASARATYDRLRREVTLLEENLEDISFGVYRPHYDFAASSEYKSELDRIWEEQKGLLRDGRATHCAVEWSVGGSKKEGARMQKQYVKALLRAFNGECDAAIAKVSWNNVVRMEERIRKALDAINELGTVMQIEITRPYLENRLAELRLSYEAEAKKREEQEEQRRIKEQMREEERVQRELEKAREEAEGDEKRYEKALAKARDEMARAKGQEVTELNERIRALQDEVRQAHERRERAISQAQMTRAGHIYLISNIGSFGDSVLKIGMTRRLEPMERIKELGDASVPFEFDVHGMLYVNDAPALEAEMHRHFDDRRVNLVNPRKEFFRVTVEEIEAFASQRSLKLQLTKLAEAREYRETLALRATKAEGDSTGPKAAATSEFPNRLL